MSSSKTDDKRKEYYPPKVVYSERMETRAVTCALADDNTGPGGPIQS